MLCTPSSGSSRFVGDCPYQRIDVTAPTARSTSKIDVAGFYCPSLKKVCNHIHSFSLHNVHHESNGGGLSYIFGAQHCGTIAGSQASSSCYMLEPLNQHMNTKSLTVTQQTKHYESISKGQVALGWKLSEQVVFYGVKCSGMSLKKNKMAGISRARCLSHATMIGTVVDEDTPVACIIDSNGLRQVRSTHLNSKFELSEYTPEGWCTFNQPNSSVQGAEPCGGGSTRLVSNSSPSDGAGVLAQPSSMTSTVPSSEGVSIRSGNVINCEPQSQLSEISHCCDMKHQRLAFKHQLSECKVNHEQSDPLEVYSMDCFDDDKQTLEGIVEEKRVQYVDDVLPSKMVGAFRMPCSRISPDLQWTLRESSLYLESLGADYSKIFHYNPKAMSCTVQQLRALVHKLELYGLKWTEQGRVFNMCPRILSLNPESGLLLITDFLFHEVGLPHGHFGKVVRRCPRLLVANVVSDLRPTLWFLRHLGYKSLGQVVSNNPSLLSFSVEKKLKPTLRFMEDLGFSYREGAAMVVRFPAIFNYSITENLQPKFEFLVHEMGGSKKDLQGFPQYFGYSLERRIKPRFECVRKHGISLSVQAMLQMSDAEFKARFASYLAKEGECSQKDLLVLSEMINAKLQNCGPGSAMARKGLECPKSQVLLTVN